MAVRQHGRAVGNDFGPVLTDGALHCDLPLEEGHRSVRSTLNRIGSAPGLVQHLVNGQPQGQGGGPRISQRFDKSGPLIGLSRSGTHRQVCAECASAAYRAGATNLHVPDRAAHLCGGADVDDVTGKWQACLVQQRDDVAIRPQWGQQLLVVDAMGQFVKS